MGLMNIAENAADTAIGAGMGLLLEKHNDARQLRQQGKLQDLQIAGQKEMTDYNMSKQLQMWHDTNYSAQRAELEKAGLNPGLLYGQSGGGGVTTGNTNGSVSGSSAPVGGGEIMGMALQRAQLGLIQAQTNNVNKDTEGKGIDNNIKGSTGMDTALANLANIKQQTSNAETQNAIMKIEKELKSWDLFFEDGNWLRRQVEADFKLDMLRDQQSIIAMDQQIKKETKDMVIKEINQRYAEGTARIALANSNINVNSAQIKNWSEQLEQKWKEIAQGNIKLQQAGRELDQQDTKIIQDWAQMGLDTLQSTIGMVLPTKSAEKVVETLIKNKKGYERTVTRSSSNGK